jgi:hypothetical protein
VYVPQTDACTVPNSRTAITPDQINASVAQYMDTNTVVARALQSFASVLNRPDLNRNGLLLSDAGGVPADPFQGFRAWPDWTEGNPAGAPPACLESRELPTSMPTDQRAAVAAPDAPPMVPQTIEGRAVMLGKQPSTGNLCLDLQKGYAMQSQVSKAMLYQCSKKRYNLAGLKATLPEVLAMANAGTLPMLPDQDVPDYDQASMGLADLPTGSGLLKALAWSVGGLFAYAAWKMSR